MGRPAGFTDDQVFAWLAGHLSQAASVTVIEVSQGTGVSVGSIYHRYGSMDDLLARAWLWAIVRQRAPLVVPLKGEGVQAAIQIALHTVRFARTDPVAATILACCPRSAFVKPGLMTDSIGEIVSHDARFEALFLAFASRSGFTPVAAELAMIRYPTCVVQMYLPAVEVPRHAELFVKKAARTTLGIGDNGKQSEHARH